MSEDIGESLAHVVSVFRQSKSMESQFIALGMLVELIMKDWPPHICMAMVAALELRFGLSGSPEQQHVVNPLIN